MSRIVVISIVISCVLSLVYALLQTAVWRGLKRTTRSASSGRSRFSIVVAARNEGANLRACLSSLIRQEYPAGDFEIILVDDRSTDATGAIAREFAERHSNLSVVSITENNTDMPNKKHALAIGIAKTRNPLLAFTDADCVVPPAWLQRLSEQYSDTVGAVAGYSPVELLQVRGAARMFLHYEELKNSVLALAGVRLGRAFLCTGRNFSYRKAVYDELGGFEQIKHSVSGDDDLFLQLIQDRTSWEIRYMDDPSAAVTTTPPVGISQFFHQRIRHISASKYYPSAIKIYYGIGHLITLFVIVGMFLAPEVALFTLLVRFNLDGLIIARGKDLLQDEVTVREFFLGELLLIVYAIVIGPLGWFRTFTWKGETAA